MQAVMKTLDRNTNINFGVEMKRKHFTLLHMRLVIFRYVQLSMTKIKSYGRKRTFKKSTVLNQDNKKQENIRTTCINKKSKTRF